MGKILRGIGLLQSSMATLITLSCTLSPQRSPDEEGLPAHTVVGYVYSDPDIIVGAACEKCGHVEYRPAMNANGTALDMSPIVDGVRSIGVKCDKCGSPQRLAVPTERQNCNVLFELRIGMADWKCNAETNLVSVWVSMQNLTGETLRIDPEKKVLAVSLPRAESDRICEYPIPWEVALPSLCLLPFELREFHYVFAPQVTPGTYSISIIFSPRNWRDPRGGVWGIYGTPERELVVAR